MKKLLVIVAVAAMFAACGQKAAENTDTAAAVDTTAVAADTTAALDTAADTAAAVK